MGGKYEVLLSDIDCKVVEKCPKTPSAAGGDDGAVTMAREAETVEEVLV